MKFDIYAEHIMMHARNPHNYGQIDGLAGISVDNPVCGDELTLYIKSDNTENVKAKFTGICCALSTASASLFTDYLKDKKISELRNITPGDVYTAFGIPVTANRSNCVLLIYLALENWLKEESSKK